MMRRHLLSLGDIPKEEFLALLTRFSGHATREEPGLPLKGKTVGMMFDRPSTRTRLSFYKAIFSLGGCPVSIHSTELQLATGEAPTDTGRMLPLYLDALVVRTRSLAGLDSYTSQTRMSVINALTDEEHPTQAIADMLTIQDYWGRLEGIRILFVGEGGNIAVSFLLACAMLSGMSVTFLTPKQYPLPLSALSAAARIDARVDSRLSETHDSTTLTSDCDIVYTTRWRSMGEEKSQRDWREHFRGFQVTTEMLQKVGGTKPALLMHDLPAERGAEVTVEALENGYSLIVRQAENKLRAAEAALCWCLGV